jgi:hypothetical protein
VGEWRRIHNKELHDLYSSLNIFWVIKSRRMRWAEHVAHMGNGRSAYRVLVGWSDGKRPLGRPWHSCKIILNRIFKKWDGREGMD